VAERPRLVVVTDRRRSAVPLPLLAAAAIAGGADLVQIREKDLSDPDLASLATSVIAYVGDPARVQINGRPDIARALGCGVHLPETAPLPRPPFPRPLSRSVHSAAQAADARGCDFVVAGHVYSTGSKEGVPPRGLDWLREVVAASRAPVVAIGGIDASNAAEAIAAGAAGVAVIGALRDAPDPEAAARALRAAIDRKDAMPDATIAFTLNGKDASIATGATVTDLLREKGLLDRLVVVERNRVILDRDLFAATVIVAGDELEVVHFVGGGAI
jgi:thiamine biosynthesis protein ThiS